MCIYVCARYTICTNLFANVLASAVRSVMNRRRQAMEERINDGISVGLHEMSIAIQWFYTLRSWFRSLPVLSCQKRTRHDTCFILCRQCVPIACTLGACASVLSQGWVHARVYFHKDTNRKCERKQVSWGRTVYPIMLRLTSGLHVGNFLRRYLKTCFVFSFHTCACAETSSV